MYNEETGQYEWIFVEQDISNEFKTDCKSIVNSYLRTGRISVLAKQLNDGTILPAFEIKQSDNLIDFTIEDNCYANDKFIGTAVGKTIKVKIFNPDNTIDLEDRTADVYVGMDINGTNEEILMGRFIFNKNKTEEVKNKSEFTGSDAMIRFNQLYKDVIKLDNDRQYPISLYTYLQWLCNEVGVVLGNESIVNGDYQVLGNAFTNNEDCKTVLSHIAQISGGIAKIGRDNKLYIINLDNSSIPNSYTRVDYIESTGTQYINTGAEIFKDDNHEIIIDFEPTLFYNYNSVWGSTFDPDRFESWIYNTGKINSRYNQVLYTGNPPDDPLTVNTRYKLDYKKDENGLSFYIDDTLIGTNSNATTYDTNADLLLFLSGTDYGKYKLYSCKIYGDNGMVRDFIPCKRNSDNKLGLYDRVEGTFYPNNGTGEFNYGSTIERDTAVETITTNNYLTDFTSANDWGELNSLVLSLNPDVEGENVEENDPESIEENGLTEMVLTNNFILIDDNERRLVLPSLWNTLKYLKYLPIQTKYFGYPYLDSGDLIAIYDTASQTTRYTYLFNHTFRYSGAYEGEIKTPALTKTQTTYKNNINIKQLFRNTELVVDKVNGKIDASIEQITTVGENALDAIDKANAAVEKSNELEITVNGTTSTVRSLQEQNAALVEQIARLEQTVNGLQLKLTEQGGNNIFYYSTEFWGNGITDSDGNEGQPNMIEITDTELKTTTISGIGYKVSSGTSRHKTIEVKDDYYTISFKYKLLNPLATAKVYINSTEIPLTSTEWEGKVDTELYSNGTLDFKIETDTDNCLLIADLMGSVGNTAQPWTQNPNETRTETVTIGKGIQVTSSTTDTITKIDADGNRVYNKQGQRVMEATDKGIYAKYLESNDGADITGLLISKAGDQIWLSSKL